MAYKMFEIPSWNGNDADIVYADNSNGAAACFIHYAYAIGSSSKRWNDVMRRRAFPLSELRPWQEQEYQRRHSDTIQRLQTGIGYYPGESVLGLEEVDNMNCINTVMRIGALELLANIFSGRITANDKDPFPHQLALQQFMNANHDKVKRLLIADEVGLGKTIEVGLVLRDILIAKGSLDEFSCVYFTSGGLVEDARIKLQEVLRGAIGTHDIVEQVRLAELQSRGGIYVTSMHAARNYTTNRSKKNLSSGVAPEIIVIDECHHCSSDKDLTGKEPTPANSTKTYMAAKQLMSGTFWPNSKPPRLVVLMSATPFRSRTQFVNLMRLLTHDTNNDRNAYDSKANEESLLSTLKEADSAISIVWRQQQDPLVKTWCGGALFPNLTVVRPHREGEPVLARPDDRYLTLMDDIRNGVRKIYGNQSVAFGGFLMTQLEKKLTSSSLAGACWIFSWCLRHHSGWSRDQEYTHDSTPATEGLRTLLREISRKIVAFDDRNDAKYSEVNFPSDGYEFSSAHFRDGNIPEIYNDPCRQ